MINALHLLWIIPLSLIAGMLTPAFFAGATQKEKEGNIYLQGVKDGQNMQKSQIDAPLSQTLEELFDRGFDSDFYKFMGQLVVLSMV